MTTPAETASSMATEKYGDQTIATVSAFQPLAFRDRLELRDSLDPALTKAWLDYSAGLFSRPHLDARTRILVLTGQFTMTGRQGRLKETVVAGLENDLDPREILEVILQCIIYGGDVILDDSLETFVDVARQYDVLDDVTRRALDVGEREAARDLDTERGSWHPDDISDPRFEPLLDKYGWHRMSMGLKLRPKHILNVVEFLDGIDEEYARLFLDFGYNRLYSRSVLDHKTRLLCMVGNTLAIGEAVQSRHHMRGAIRQGADPREVLEVLFQTCAVFGHPNIMPRAVRDCVDIAREELGADLAGNECTFD